MNRVAVVGAGVMGCAAAWALTERGADVTVFEQFELDHDRGSSHGRSRIVRLAYPEAHWVRLAAEAMAAWRELEAESGAELLGLYGLVELASSPELTSAAALDACGAPYRRLDAAGARQLGVVLPAGWAARALAAFSRYWKALVYSWAMILRLPLASTMPECCCQTMASTCICT